jgi:hypothetical protein
VQGRAHIILTTTPASLAYKYPGNAYRTSSGSFATSIQGRKHDRSWHSEVSDEMQTRLRGYVDGELS